jgi:hypothetical protein
MTDPLQKLSWDDLRIIKAIGESGGLAAGADMISVGERVEKDILSAARRVPRHGKRC